LKRKQKMTNYTFPCASVNGLTTAQKRAAIEALRASLVADREQAKAGKIAAAEAKRATAIAKAEARLAKLLAKSVGPVGAKAVKANKRPSKGVTFGAEANDLAAKIKAGVSTI
jgi:microcystin-dependent protein